MSELPDHGEPPSSVSLEEGAPPDGSTALRPAPGVQLRAEARPGLLALLAAVVLGAPLGLLWSAVAPRPQALAKTTGVDFADLETKAFIAEDLLLLLLGVTAGVLLALLAWRLARRTFLGILLGSVLGGLLGAVVMWRTGLLVDDREAVLATLQHPAVGALLDLPLKLRAKAALLGWPAGAAVTLTVLVLRNPRVLPE